MTPDSPVSAHQTAANHTDVVTPPEFRKSQRSAPNAAVTIAAIDEQRNLGWPDFHPEDYCHRCGHRNITWSVDSDRFNLAMGGPPATHNWNGIICPQCFVELHEAETGLCCSWTLQPLTHFRPIEDGHP